MFLEIEADLEDTIAYFMAHKVHEDVTGFLRARPEFLHKFDRDANASPSPRSWDRVATILEWGLDPVCEAEAISGQIGRSAYANLKTHMDVYSKCPDVDKLIANPDTAEIVEEPAIMYALCSTTLDSQLFNNHIFSLLY